MLKAPKVLCSPGITSRRRRCRVQPNPVGYARMPVSPIARWGVRAKISSTGTIPGTTSAGGSTQAGRRYATSDGSSGGGSGGSDTDTTRC